MSLTLRLSVLCSTHTHTSAHFLYLSLHLSSSFSSLERGNREGRNDRVRGFTEDWLFIIVFGPLNSDSNRMRWGEKPVPLITVSGGPEPSADASISHVPGRGTQSDFQASRPRSTAVQPPTWGCWRMNSAGGGGEGKEWVDFHTQSSSNVLTHCTYSYPLLAANLNKDQRYLKTQNVSYL